MELLNVLAQIVAITGIFLWMTLKAIWRVIFVAFEIIRDYTPIFARKTWIFLKRMALFVKKWSGLIAHWISVQSGAGSRQLSVRLKIAFLKIRIALRRFKLSSGYALRSLGTNGNSSIRAFFATISRVPVKKGVLAIKLPMQNLVRTLAEGLVQLMLIIFVGLKSLTMVRISLPSIQLPNISVPRISLPTIKIPQFSKPDVPQYTLTPASSSVFVGVGQTRKRSKLFSRLSLAGMAVSFMALFFIFFPDLVFAIIPLQTDPIESAVNKSALGGSFADGNLYSSSTLPEKNEYLPDGNWLVIPKIGVLTQIHEAPTESHEEALKNGVWRVPEFADPTTGSSYPTILVAHKFGYLAWTNKFRRQNSFYNLEKLEIGDTFDVIWDHRKFTYEIYAGEEGKEITDYKADMILYTCKYLNSPARIFRYARRVEY